MSPRLVARLSVIRTEAIYEGGIASKLYFNGADLPTTKMLSAMLGMTEEFRTNPDGTIYVKNKPVMSLDEIRTMNDNEALFLMTNKLPLKLNITPYYKDFRFNRYSKEKPFQINSSINDIEVEYIDLNLGSDGDSEE